MKSSGKPQVSVIIPNYNHSAFLQYRIESVLSQTYQDFEVIILDDYSTDNSRDIIEQYQNNEKISHIIFNQTNSGSTFKQWQKGIALAMGSYLWIAESDDYCEKNFLETAMQKINDSESELFFCQSYDVDENNKVKGDFFWSSKHITTMDWHNACSMEGNKFIDLALKYQNVIYNASAVVFKKTNFKFDQIIKYKTCGDWLFWINLLNSPSAKISYLPVQLNYFRTHASATRNHNTEERYVRYVVEDLSVKYCLYKLAFIKKEEFYNHLKKGIDSVIAYLQTYTRICQELNLPNYFISLFWLRKIRFKYYQVRKKLMQYS